MEKLITCSLSKEPTSSPVICLKTGFIFDQQQIKIYLEKNGGSCPLTKQQVKFPEDFKIIHGLRGPTLNTKCTADRNAKSLKVTENFVDLLSSARKNKKEIDDLKIQLVASLKQQEASLNVIKKLKHQRDEARSFITQYKDLVPHESDTEADFEGEDTSNIVEIIDSTQEGIKALEYKAEEKFSSNIEDSKFSKEAREYQELLKIESFRIKNVRKELSKNFKSSKVCQLLTQRDSAVSLKQLANINIPDHKNDSTAHKLVIQHPYDQNLILVSGKQPVLLNLALDDNTDSKKEMAKLKIQNRDSNPFESLSILLSYPEISDEEQFGFIAVDSTNRLLVGSVTLDEDEFGSVKIFSAVKLEGGQIKSLCKHPVSNLLVTLDCDRNVSLYDISRGREVLSYLVDDDLELTHLSVHPDGKLVSLSGTNGQIHFLDLTSGQILITMDCLKVILLYLLNRETA